MGTRATGTRRRTGKAQLLCCHPQWSEAGDHPGRDSGTRNTNTNVVGGASMSVSSTEAIRFYCGIGGEKTYNHHPISTGPYACISPVYGRKLKRVNVVAVPAGAQVIQ